MPIFIDVLSDVRDMEFLIGIIASGPNNILITVVLVAFIYFGAAEVNGVSAITNGLFYRCAFPACAQYQ